MSPIQQVRKVGNVSFYKKQQAATEHSHDTQLSELSQSKSHTCTSGAGQSVLPFAYNDVKRLAEITKLEKYRCLFDKTGKQELEDIKHQKKQISLKMSGIKTFVDTHTETLAFVRNRIEEGAGCTEEYDKNKWMDDNYEKQAAQFRLSESANWQSFLAPEQTHQTMDEAFRQSLKVGDLVKVKTGHKQIWKPNKFNPPKTLIFPNQ